MRKPRPTKRGKSPWLAALLLLAGMGVVGRNLLGVGVDNVAPRTDALADAMPEDVVSGEQAADDSVKWKDLLPEYGSWSGGDVRLAFVAFEYPSAWAGPTGVGIDAPAGRWVGEDPPLLRLGVVMVSKAARRAVLGGKVVGLGDTVEGGQVKSIQPGHVVLEWDGRHLTYDLEASAPREFRAELAQRQREQGDKDEAAGTADPSRRTTDDKNGADVRSGADKKEGNE